MNDRTDEGAEPEVGDDAEFSTQAESLFEVPEAGEGAGASPPLEFAAPAPHAAAAEKPRRERSTPATGATAAARQVASIVSAAEQSAERMRVQTEDRVRSRIAEGERAAQNRISAAEEEAADIVKWAQEEGTRLREAGRVDSEQSIAEATSEALTIVARAQEATELLRNQAEQAKTAATSEALTIVANAQESAETTTKEAADSATKQRADAEARSRELLSEARTIANDVRTEGMEVAANLRELGDSLRSNADRLLRDVQSIHTRLVAQIERADAKSGRPPAGRLPAPSSSRVPSSDGPGTAAAARVRRERDVPAPPADGEVLEVPEFIPPG